MAGLFSSQPKPPVVTPQAPMPVPDDQGAIMQKRRQAAAQAAQSGRASTIMSDYGTSDKLG